MKREFVKGEFVEGQRVDWIGWRGHGISRDGYISSHIKRNFYSLLKSPIQEEKYLMIQL